MGTLLLYGIAILVALFGLKTLGELIGTKKKPDTSRAPYGARKSLLTVGELDIYRKIIAELPGNFHLCPKVNLNDVLQPGENGWKNGDRNRISQKHLDLVIIDSDTGRIRLAIEIDDRSHNKPKAQQNDQFKNNALAEARIPLLRIAPRQSIAIEEILQAMAA